MVVALARGNAWLLAGDIEVYAAELASLLQRKAASVAALQQKVHHFRKLMKAAMEKQGKPSDF